MLTANPITVYADTSKYHKNFFSQDSVVTTSPYDVAATNDTTLTTDDSETFTSRAGTDATAQLLVSGQTVLTSSIRTKETKGAEMP
jgi:hypothetical protein